MNTLLTAILSLSCLLLCGVLVLLGLYLRGLIKEQERNAQYLREGGGEEITPTDLLNSLGKKRTWDDT